MSIDLHTHSTRSDGTMSPSDLVRYAHQKGLSAIAITDHDSIDGIEEAVVTGNSLGIEVVPGIELSVKFLNYNIHLLGYLLDWKNKDLMAASVKLQEGRLERNKKIISKLNMLGLSIQYSELHNNQKTRQNGRPHIARLMIEKGFVQSMDEAFSKFLGQEGVAYTSRFIYGVEEAIRLIKDAGGIAVLAHPLKLNTETDGLTYILEQLCNLGLDGVEVYYPNHSRKFRRQLCLLAEKFSLVMTGGSDYHGSIRPGTTLAGGKNVSVPAHLLDIMKERTLENRKHFTIKFSC